MVSRYTPLPKGLFHFSCLLLQFLPCIQRQKAPARFIQTDASLLRSLNTKHLTAQPDAGFCFKNSLAGRFNSRLAHSIFVKIHQKIRFH